MPSSDRFDAVILAGGRATRLGHVCKPQLRVGGRSLMQRALEAARSVGAARIVVAGPEALGRPPLLHVREDPEFGGPLAGLAAAVPLLEARWTLVLAADLPWSRDGALALAAECERLDALAGATTDAVVLSDGEGRQQWLLGAYRTEALRRAVSGGDLRDVPVRQLASAFRVLCVPAPEGATVNINTRADLERARMVGVG